MIKNKACINEDNSGSLDALKKEIVRLKLLLEENGSKILKTIDNGNNDNEQIEKF